MVTQVYAIRSLDELRDYILATLVDRYDLQPEAFKISQRVISRRGRPCGLHFSVWGPRAIRFTAIWETERNCILFYGSDGERFQKTQLIEAPTLETVLQRHDAVAA